jgi:hypothetical protein
LAGLFADSGLQLPEAGERSLSVRPDLMRSLYEAPVVLSVSQLEKYASCPFSHLAERLLSLQMRPEWRPEVTETGVLLHGVLEQALQAVRQDLLALPEPERERLAHALWDRWLQADLSALIDAWMRETAEREGLERLFDAGSTPPPEGGSAARPSPRCKSFWHNTVRKSTSRPGSSGFSIRTARGSCACRRRPVSRSGYAAKLTGSTTTAAAEKPRFA